MSSRNEKNLLIDNYMMIMRRRKKVHFGSKSSIQRQRCHTIVLHHLKHQPRAPVQLGQRQPCQVFVLSGTNLANQLDAVAQALDCPVQQHGRLRGRDVVRRKVVKLGFGRGFGVLVRKGRGGISAGGRRMQLPAAPVILLE